MGEKFNKIKRKFTVEAILKCAAIGLSFGALLLGVLLLSFKLSAIKLNALWYVLIFFAAALAVGGGLFFLFKPTDKKVAIKLDSEYNLHERVQTALSFKDCEGELLELQRSDTAAALSALTLKKPTFKQLWKYALALIVALVIAITAIAVPAKAVEGGAANPPGGETAWEDRPYHYSVYDSTCVEGLLWANSEKISLRGELNALIGEELNGLNEKLALASTNGEMYAAVTGAITAIDTAVKQTASYYPVATALNALRQSAIVRAILSVAEEYVGSSYATGTDVRNFYSALVFSADSKISAALAPLKEKVTALSLVRLENGIANVVRDIREGLENSLISEEDALYIALKQFADGLEITDADGVEALFDALVPALADELSEQAYALAADVFFADALNEQFLLSQPERRVSVAYRKITVNAAEDEGDGENEGDENNKGGHGDGDREYGGDDLVYDPDTGEYVPYGELLDKYYALVNQLLEEGLLSEEQAAIVRAYFHALYK